MKISLREYLRNKRHSIGIWRYSLTCKHNWLYDDSYPPPYWHCTKCGRVTDAPRAVGEAALAAARHPTPIKEFPMAKPGATMSTQKLNSLEGEELRTYLDNKFGGDKSRDD